ncbi:unnamed protein product [Acidithrix sp. C25]|nr:unnamed protein product [Acidithrix sp. C25]
MAGDLNLYLTLGSYLRILDEVDLPNLDRELVSTLYRRFYSFYSGIQ